MKSYTFYSENLNSQIRKYKNMSCMGSWGCSILMWMQWCTVKKKKNAF